MRVAHHDGAHGAGDVGDERVVDAVDGAQRLLDLAGVDGGAADLEHVVGSAVVEHEAVVVEVAEVAGGVVAVGGEQLLAAAPADARATCAARGSGSCRSCRRARAAPVSGSTMRTSMPVERLTAAAPCRSRHVGVGGVAAVGPERLGHAEQLRARTRRRPLVGRQQRLQAARPQRGQVGSDRVAIGAPGLRPGRASRETA